MVGERFLKNIFQNIRKCNFTLPKKQFFGFRLKMFSIGCGICHYFILIPFRIGLPSPLICSRLQKQKENKARNESFC